MTNKSFFWHGILALNDFGEHAFFDIKVRKSSKENSSHISIYTSDVPPIPVQSEDTVRVTFLLENSVGLNTVRYKVAESIFLGRQLAQKTANVTSQQNFVSVNTEDSEWHFMRQANCWVLYFISVKIPASKLKKFLTVI
ncbi:hypothetical protein M0811_02597 [Anaeramoeba ignava]|uniref:Uncharacterized protein n=1 Tax=Anaeramoeba ignava TaxID=1746090 RepID=A0A9Q0R7E6_ANAIG|nr:hypothetical protein M0811_02597 [Anaeramoeba ignava]|eukprot:Anaeramoba_ignava/a352620_39.p1 GENE.a352620_39~~a352620_39.p1  ORF type:complete len:148 (+),score=31.33 a352620_39:30-446(+)